MSFTELRHELNTSLEAVNSTQDYVMVYLTTSVQDQLKALEEHYVEHLYGDLIRRNPTENIQEFLTGSYKSANEFAKTCIHTVFRSRDLYGFRLAGWTDSALKCFDNFLLILIQEKLDETIINRKDKGLERQKYWHLIDKGGDYYSIGTGFDVVYQTRNDFTHIEIIDDKTGRRRQRPLSNKRINEMKILIFQNLEKALVSLEKFIN